MTDFVMPSLGADMQSGTLVEWLVAAGEAVHRGQSIAVVETAKGAIEIESFVDGVVEEMVRQPGDEELAVGTVLARIRAADETAQSAAPASKEVAPTPVAPREQPVPPTTAPGPVEPAVPQAPRLRISPAARRLAVELQVDLTKVIGSGPDGAIQRADIERAHAQQVAPPPPAGSAPTEPAAKTGTMRRAIAAATSRANREIPHYYLSRRINLQTALQWLEEQNRARPIRERMLPVAVLVWAVAKALSKVRELNGFWLEDSFQPAEQIGIGFTVALKKGGLVMPVIKGEALTSPQQTMAELSRLISRARDGHLSQSDMDGASISVTNLGDLGVDSVYGVIFPPQVAIVGFGRIAAQPWAEGDTLAVRPVVTASLAADHRATDGLTGARFLQRLNSVLKKMEVAP